MRKKALVAELGTINAGIRSQLATHMTFIYQISVERGKEAVARYLKGRIDLESSPLLRNQLTALLRRQPRSNATDLVSGILAERRDSNPRSAAL